MTDKLAESAKNQDGTGPGLAGGILSRQDGSTIAYNAVSGKSPGIVFLHGFKSDRNGGKALFAERYCRQRGLAFVRYDALGHGTSSGTFEDGTIGQWADDAVTVIDELTQGPQILIGSSMGGWLMLLAALKRRHRVAALVGLAAAPDFTEDLIWKAGTPEQQNMMVAQGFIEVPNCYSDIPYRITHGLIEEGRNHLLLDKPIPLTCPVRLIHGQKDADVPWPTALRLAAALDSDDVEVTLVKNAGHRLSDPEDMDRLERVLDEMVGKVITP